MKTIKIKAYKFNELSKEAKERAIEENREVNIDYEWYDFITESWKEKLEGLGYYKPEIYFSGFGAQGDGACFTAVIDVDLWIEKHRAKTRFRKLRKEIDDGAVVGIELKHGGRYYHEYSVSAVADGFCDLSDTAGNQLSELAGWIEEDMQELSRKIYRELEREYFARIDDNAVAETLEINDFLFLDDGSGCLYL